MVPVVHQCRARESSRDIRYRKNTPKINDRE